MNTLLIDIETYSAADLPKCGVHKYVEDDSFRVLLFAYSVDLAPAVIVDLASGEEIPQEVADAIFDPTVSKIAHNMTFELTCLSKYFGRPMLPEQWHDTMIWAAYLGFPARLSQLGEVLRLEQQKLKEGTLLINYWSKPTKDKRQRVPSDNPVKWERYKEYCLRDVDTEVEVAKRLQGKLPVPEWEREVQLLDYKINSYGVKVDTQLARNAIGFWDRCSAELLQEVKSITDLPNPNSIIQLKEWLAQRGLQVDALDKAALRELLAGEIEIPAVRRVLEIRQDLGRTSVKKYEALLAMACSDDRVRGIAQYYGTFTGRFAGRGLQLQNLRQNHLRYLKETREMLYYNDYESMEMMYASIPDVLSQLIRTALIPSEGHIFHVCDFNAIEARVTAWLSGEEWVLDTFRNGGDIYCVTASRMFGVPVDKKGENSELRTPGKIATLACGYGGGKNAFDSMAKAYGLEFSDEEKERYVAMWRTANPHTVGLWKIMERAFVAAIHSGNCSEPIEVNRGIKVRMQYGCLLVELPSGRIVSYPRTKVTETEKGYEITYERLNQTTKKWEVSKTYGGKIVENVVQAISRDILCLVMLKLDKQGHKIAFHVHDECIIDSPDHDALPKIEAIFGEEIPWAKGLPLRGAGYSTPFYMKD
jgi:DNA polymerase